MKKRRCKFRNMADSDMTFSFTCIRLPTCSVNPPLHISERRDRKIFYFSDPPPHSDKVFVSDSVL